MTDTVALRALALAAYHGERGLYHPKGVSIVQVWSGPYGDEGEPDLLIDVRSEYPERDAAYIAACNPDVILALLSDQAALAARVEAEQEAVALGRRLLSVGYEDYHVVSFSASGYGLQHPIECRPDLIGCRFNQHLADADGPEEDPGRYRMDWPDGWPTYAALAPVQPASPEVAG